MRKGDERVKGRATIFKDLYQMRFMSLRCFDIAGNGVVSIEGIVKIYFPVLESLDLCTFFYLHKHKTTLMRWAC